MERLTMKSDKGGLAFAFDLDITCEKSEIEKILKLGEKLAAYEDTNLTPEQIKEIDKLYQEKCEEVNKLKAESLTGLEMAEIYATLSHYKQAKEQMNEIEKAKSINKLINDSDINTEFLYNWQIDFIRELCERQIPKKPMLMQLAEPEYMCECGMKYWRKGGVKYCIECGQKLDWSVEE